jgi:rhodanese-related sulfurtransferase
MLFLSSCGQSSDSGTAVLNAENFEQMINESENEIILDVRTPEEFAGGHIPGAVLMNINESNFQESVNELDKSKAVFVYCAAGIRSEKASAY